MGEWIFLARSIRVLELTKDHRYRGSGIGYSALFLFSLSSIFAAAQTPPTNPAQPASNPLLSEAFNQYLAQNTATGLAIEQPSTAGAICRAACERTLSTAVHPSSPEIRTGFNECIRMCPNGATAGTPAGATAPGAPNPPRCTTPFSGDDAPGSSTTRSTQCCEYDWKTEIDATCNKAHGCATLTTPILVGDHVDEFTCSQVRRWRANYYRNHCDQNHHSRHTQGSQNIRLGVYRARLLACGCAAHENHDHPERALLHFGGALPANGDRCANYSMTTEGRTLTSAGATTTLRAGEASGAGDQTLNAAPAVDSN